MYLQIAVSIISSIINVITQIISFRCLKKVGLGLLKSEYLGFFMGFLSLILFEFYIFSKILISTEDFLVLFTVNLIIYFCFAYSYFTFLNLGETGRRIRLLRELYDAKDGLSMDELLERYNAKLIIEKRLDRLIHNAQIVCKDGRYYIGNPTMLLFAKIILMMKLIILGKKSEFN